MKIYAMPADAYPGAVQDIQDWSRGIWGDDHIATIRGLASQIVGRDANIAELESQAEHWRQFSGKLEARARVRAIELDALKEAVSTLALDAAHARADRYGRTLTAAVELIP